MGGSFENEYLNAMALGRKGAKKNMASLRRCALVSLRSMFFA
jgi:hypothetical protein